MRELDLNLLHVLVAIDQHRSVSAAALALRRSQPSVSVALRKLRDYFADPLFVRTGNIMQPTPRAAGLIRSAQAILARVDLDIVAASAFDALTTRSVVT